MKQKVLVTGAKGFIGRNFIAELHNRGVETIYECDIDTTKEALAEYVRQCEIVYHFAGVNRPQNEKEFTEGNTNFTEELLEALRSFSNSAPVIMTSSTQAALDHPYGRSKKAAEDLLFAHAKKSGAQVFVFRLPGVFGKWCRPHYNSVVATFCHQIARDEPIAISDPTHEIPLVYIDDVLDALFLAGEGKAEKEGDFCSVPITYQVSLGSLAEEIRSFRCSRTTLRVPELEDPFTRKLYSTYLSYLAEDDFSYPLTMKCDERGSFTEFLKTPDRGQVSVNVTKPGITKGNHWHHTKNEKFLVVAGRASIRFRKIGETKVTEYIVDGSELTVVDIPTGYTHNITNIGTQDLVTVMWANESFDPMHPDTFFEPV